MILYIADGLMIAIKIQKRMNVEIMYINNFLKERMMRPEYEVMDGRKYPIIWRKKGNDKTENCPYCNKQHMHGINEGHRSSHCKSFMKYGRLYDKHQTPEYYQFTADDGDVIYATRGYILREYHD